MSAVASFRKGVRDALPGIYEMVGQVFAYAFVIVGMVVFFSFVAGCLWAAVQAFSLATGMWS